MSFGNWIVGYPDLALRYAVRFVVVALVALPWTGLQLIAQGASAQENARRIDRHAVEIDEVRAHLRVNEGVVSRLSADVAAVQSTASATSRQVDKIDGTVGKIADQMWAALIALAFLLVGVVAKVINDRRGRADSQPGGVQA